MTINGSSDVMVEVFYQIGDDEDIVFEVPKAPGATITLHMYPGTCSQFEPPNPILHTFAGGGTYSIKESYVHTVGSFPDLGRHELAVYAKRDTDGAQSPCQFIAMLETGEEPPTATPPPPVTPTIPATTAPTPFTVGVTGLPQTGSGSGSPPVFPTMLLVIAIPLFVAAFGIERRRHRRASR
jgi:hypothetical protein